MKLHVNVFIIEVALWTFHVVYPLLCVAVDLEGQEFSLKESTIGEALSIPPHSFPAFAGI